MTHVHLTPCLGPDPDERYHLARVGSVEIRVLDFAVQRDPDGLVVLNLVVPIDSLTIGDPLLSQNLPQVRPSVPTVRGNESTSSAKVVTWGDPSVPDPRTDLPGWQPEKLSEQVAQNVRDAVNRAGGILA